MRTWKLIAWALNSAQPILLTGEEGCGKTDCILAIAMLNGSHVHQCCLTPETDSSTLVGQLTPNDNPDSAEHIVWSDGIVTKAFVEGSWALLDNLNQAEANVLERLNPVVWAQVLQNVPY